MVFGSFTSLNTTFDGDISRIFSAKDLIDSLNNNFDYQYDASEVVFADFQHASVKTGQLPQVNQSKEDYLGFFPPTTDRSNIIFKTMELFPIGEMSKKGIRCNLVLPHNGISNKRVKKG